MKLSKAIIPYLVCPISKCKLEYNEEKAILISREAKLVYPVINGVPIILPEKAVPLNDNE